MDGRTALCAGKSHSVLAAYHVVLDIKTGKDRLDFRRSLDGPQSAVFTAARN